MRHDSWKGRSAALILVVIAASGCVDSELGGVAPGVTATGTDATLDFERFDVFSIDTDDVATDTTPPPDGADTVDPPDGGPCLVDADCEGAFGTVGPCDQPVCGAAGVCELRPAPDCCAADADCPISDDPCVASFCPAPGAACVLEDRCDCQADADCAERAPACTTGACISGTCEYESISVCCREAADCDDADPCTAEQCTDGACEVRDIGGASCCAAAPVVTSGFEPPPTTLLTTSGSPNVQWQAIRTPLAFSPPGALYMGDADAMSYASAGNAAYAAEARIALGPATPGATVEVKFRLRLDLRDRPDVDGFQVEVRSTSGEGQAIYIKGDGPLGEWHAVKAAATFFSTGQLSLHFRFSSGADGGDPGRIGVLIDDLVARTACGGGACGADDQCVSDDPCVDGRCANGECVFATRPDCCASAADCPPTGPCAEAVCVSNQCQEFPLPGCCRVAADCGAPQPCTVMECVAETCVSSISPDCCTSDTQCNDGNPCTDDRCGDDGDCVFVGDPGCCVGPDCCEPDVWSADFDSGAAAAGWQFENSSPEVGWVITDALEAFSPPGVLYYGNPEARSYDFGVSRGRATLPWLIVPANAQAVALTWMMWLGVEDIPGFDDVAIAVQPAGGEPQVVWSKLEAPVYGEWFQGFVDLGPWQGQEVRLRFELDTGDDLVNEGLGVLVDNVAVQARCDGGGECTTAIDCGPGPPCTQAQCSAGACVYAPLPNCCAADSDCTDDIFCSLDRCVGGSCVNELVAGCCQADDECADNSPCTADFCDAANAQCRHDALPGCCNSPADCDDGSPCSIDQCDAATGLCSWISEAGCCASANDCFDGNSCTADFCDVATGECQNIPTGDCCQSAADCVSPSPCVSGACDVASGQCEFETVPGCCTGPAECDDDDACTDDFCDFVSGACFNEPSGDCCSADGDCDDGNQCTSDFCGPNGQCQFNVDINCCSADADCDDDNACTSDQCFTFQGFGICQHEPQAGNGCCAFGGQCAAQPCATAACVDFQCAYQPVTGCCTSAAECDDANPCTADACSATGACSNQADGSCCAGADACNDGDPCTTDACDALTGDCAFTAITGCCSSDVDCDNGNPCTADTCQGGACQHPFQPFCCSADGDCDDDNACTADSCFIVPGTGGLAGLCQYEPSGEAGCCSAADDCPAAPCEEWGCSEALQCELLSVTDGCCASGADCDDGDPCTDDVCDAAAGTCSNAPRPDCCEDGTTTCCQVDADCDDGNACTINRCAGEQCEAAAIPGCCTSDADCLVDGVCVIGRCDVATSECFTEPDPQCCTDHEECDDGNPCTADNCDVVSGRCENDPTPGCCSVDSDCDDGDCTLDQCVVLPTGVALCTNEPDPGCACTDAVALEEGFDDPTGLDGWQITPPRQPGIVTWWRNNQRTTSSPWALYMGDLNTQSYDNGATPVATARGQSFAVPDTNPFAYADFNVWLDIEEVPDFDLFEIRVVSPFGGGATTVWTKAAVPSGSYQQWAAAVLDLTAWRGQTIQLEFHFDAVDEISNFTEGIYIDDIVVTSACEQRPICNSDLDCDDGDPCTVDACNGSVCASTPDPGLPGCCVDQVWLGTRFNDLDGWFVNSDGSGAQWQLFDGRAVSAPTAVYYGVPSQENFNTGGRNQGRVTSSAFTIDPGATNIRILFETWVDVQVQSQLDIFDVNVLAAAGSFTVWNKGNLAATQYRSWQTVAIDVPGAAAGQTLELQFAFDSVNGGANNGEGIYVDDVRVISACE